MMGKLLDPLSRAEREPIRADTPGTFVTYTTDSVPIAERLDFWREGVMRRISPVGGARDGGSFRGRLNRAQGEDAEMLDVASNAWTAKRDEERCRRDGYDDISFNLMVAGLATHRHGAEERSLRPGMEKRPIHVVNQRIGVVVGVGFTGFAVALRCAARGLGRTAGSFTDPRDQIALPQRPRVAS
jgi:hypothetical protein